MPCRCCSSVNPCNGMSNSDDQTINHYLKRAAAAINRAYPAPEWDQRHVHYEWTKAFEHHLLGCPEKQADCN